MHLQKQNISPNLNINIENQKSRTWVEVDRSAILHNLKQFKNIVGKNVQLAVVAKSNAYGHGLIPIVQILEECNEVDWLCIFNLSDALIARENNFNKNILVLGYADLDLEIAIIYSIDIVVYSLEIVKQLNEKAKKIKKKVFVHVKIDTGLSRLGLMPNEALELIKICAKLPYIVIRGIFSHFAESDANDQAFTNKQLHRFNLLLNKIKDFGIDIPLIHSSNTAGIIRFDNCHFNFARTGGGTYGLYKSAAIDELGKKKYQLSLKLAISWKSKVMQIKDLPVGTYVSYARTFITYRLTKVAIVPIGYWDGYSRLLSNKGIVYIKGQPSFVIGRVCMNMIILDITDTKNICIGDEVTLVGNHPGATPDDIAQATNSINYEVITKINPLIPRIIV